MAQMVRDRGKQALLFNVPAVNEAILSRMDERRSENAVFPPAIAKELREKRDYHHAHLQAFCEGMQVPLADICSRLRDEHFGDGLHPNAEGARMIAEEVYKALVSIHKPQR